MLMLGLEPYPLLKASILIILAFSISSTCLTITRSLLFTRFRAFIRKNTSFGEVFACPYCLSHWISFVIIIIRPNLRATITDILFLDLFLTAMFLVGVSAILSGLIFKSISTIYEK